MDKLTPVPGYKGLYSVTVGGKVWSHRRNKYMTLVYDRKGYTQVLLYKNKIPKCFWVHRIIANTFLPPIDGKMYINHKNSIRDDNRLSNLEWCTMRENVIHGWKSGRKAVAGSAHPRAKLNENDILTIRKHKDTKHRELAKHFGVTTSVITNILNGKTWRHVL